MKITRNSLDTHPGPSDWFTGDVFIDTVTTHIAVQQADGDGNVVSWGEHVTDEEYSQAREVNN